MTTGAGGNVNATPPPRGECKGWSAHALRRNLLFLYSVDETRLDGLEGRAVTLTVKICPKSPDDWRKARRAFEKAMIRSGAKLVHWVIEWQRRGVPHFHMAIFWPDGEALTDPEIIQHWLRIAAPWRPEPRAQHVTAIFDEVGWNKYTSKHAARGLNHYQRNPANVPIEWRSRSTGRMWGHVGDWPIQEPVKFALGMVGFWKYRRIVRSWRIANAREPKRRELLDADGRRTHIYVTVTDSRRIRSARGMLRCHDPKRSAVRGCSEWLPATMTHRIMEHIAKTNLCREATA